MHSTIRPAAWRPKLPRLGWHWTSAVTSWASWRIAPNGWPMRQKTFLKQLTSWWFAAGIANGINCKKKKKGKQNKQKTERWRNGTTRPRVLHTQPHKTRSCYDLNSQETTVITNHLSNRRAENKISISCQYNKCKTKGKSPSWRRVLLPMQRNGGNLSWLLNPPLILPYIECLEISHLFFRVTHIYIYKITYIYHTSF